jgi:type III secretion system YscI/HrpB-like protein
MHGPSSAELVELQYEVMNLSFQQEVVAKVADKTSNAVQTLVKNQ